MQIYLDGVTNATWALWLSCSDDRGGNRYMRSQFLLKDAELCALERDLPVLLKSGFAILNDWRTRPDELAFATRLAPR